MTRITQAVHRTIAITIYSSCQFTSAWCCSCFVYVQANGFLSHSNNACAPKDQKLLQAVVEVAQNISSAFREMSASVKSSWYARSRCKTAHVAKRSKRARLDPGHAAVHASGCSKISFIQMIIVALLHTQADVDCRNHRTPKNISQANGSLKTLFQQARGNEQDLAAYKTHWAYSSGKLFNTALVCTCIHCHLDQASTSLFQVQ